MYVISISGHCQGVRAFFAGRVLAMKAKSAYGEKRGQRGFPVDTPQEGWDTPVVEPQEEAWAKENRRFCRGRWI